MLWAAHKLLCLNAGELRERPIWCFITPDTLAGGEHWVATITFLVVAVVLIAMYHYFVANFPALNFVANFPDNTGRVGASDMVFCPVNVKW